ncbi:MAG: S8 family serine peptidase [Microcoleaceae cyanobacterium]
MVFLPDNTITGLPSDDVMIGTPDSDEIYGFVGSDVVIGAENIDLLYGNEDADQLYGSQGDDTLYGGQEDDILFGGQGNDLLYGDAGNDTLYGDQGADTLTGGDGNDVVVIGRGTGGANLATADVMTDFDVTADQIQLLDGLSFGDLTITSTETGGTVISEAVTGEVLIVLEGVAPVALTSDRFIPEPPIDEGGGVEEDFEDPPVSPEEGFEDVELTPPVIEAQLTNDTGNSDTDNITSDPSITGTVTDSSGLRNLEASFGDEDEFIDVSDALLPDGTFTLNLTQLEEVSGGELADGDYTLLLRSQDTVLNTSQPPTLVSFSLDTTAPDISVELANDTGDSNTDGVTTDPTVTGTITDAGEIVALRAGFDGNLTDISDELGADGSFELNQLDLQILQGTPLVDGEISLEVEAEDEFGQVSGTTLSFTLDTTTPPPPPPGDNDGDDPGDNPGDEDNEEPDVPDVDIPDMDEDTPVEMVNNGDMEVTPPGSDEEIIEDVEEDPGDTPEEALNITVSSDETVYTEEVGEEDLNDFYTFTIGANSGVDISVDNIGEEVDLFLLDSNQEVIDSSEQLGLTAESITRPLEAGTYTVQVTSVNERTTEYDLNISVTPNIPGVSTTGSEEIIGEFGTIDSSALINLEPPASDPSLDAFRSDPRFEDIDGSGYAVVILDSGLDLDHPFFGPDSDGNGVADRVVYQFDYGDYDANASDFIGHGTGITSIIASEDPTFTGMAPGVDIIHLKVGSDTGGPNAAAVEQALQWVAQNVEEYNIVSVNMSFGLADSLDLANSQEEQTPASIGISDELAEIASQDVIVVAASGNSFFEFDSEEGVGYPSSDPNSLSVGAVWDENIGPYGFPGSAIDFTTDADRIIAFSQRDPDLTDIFAPGGEITVATADGGITTTAGTSQAAAHVSGIAVLAQQLAEDELGRRLTFDEFQTLISETGVSIFDGDDEDDNVFNTFEEYQRVDVLALAEAITELDAPPPPAPPELVRYDFTYFYDGDNFDILNNDFYVGYFYDEPGAYSVNTLYDVFSFDNEADSNGLYFVSEVSEAPSNAFEDAVYITDYYDADFSEGLYTPYWSGLGFASGYSGLGSEYDFVEDLDGDFFDFGNDFYEADVFDPFFVTQLFSRTDYDATDVPGLMVNADLNNDGTDELIVANTDGLESGFSVLPNLGDGSFGLPEDYTTDFLSSGAGDDPSLDVGDFDGDGNIDIVAANPETDEISIFFGDGNGNLSLPTILGVGDRPIVSETADIDSDGTTDIVLVDSEEFAFPFYTGDGVSILFNEPSLPVTTLFAGAGVTDVVSADLDGDGDVDLATANELDDTLSILYNFGNLAFSVPVTVPVGSRPVSIVADDFDGDGSTDLATANFEFGTVSVVLNNGDGSFGSADFFFANDFPSTMSSADLDADGDADLILRNSVFRGDDTQEGNSISILQNNGDGTFASPQSFTVGDVPVGLIVEDLDGNGLLDIATSNFEDQTVTVYLQSLLITT